jgi:hypothetical protein
LAYLPCLCEVRDLRAEGKEIIIEEDIEYADAIIKLAEDIDKSY